MLAAGGGAVDAVIAALAMACLCEPVLCSPGAGGFAMVRDGERGEHRLIDFFVHTPLERAIDVEPVREIHADFGPATQGFHIGPATAATPGFVAGIEHLHRLAGSIPLDELLAPTVAASRAGIDVTPFQRRLATVVAPIITATPAAADLFAPGGTPLGAGGRFANPGLGEALEMVGEGRSDAVGDAMVALQTGRGHLTRNDLDRYPVIERTPVSVAVGPATVHLPPLPTAGGVLAAHTLAQLDALGRDPSASELAAAVAATGRARRDADGDLSRIEPGTLRTRGTTHVSVMDRSGNACAVTVTNGEGNGELVDGLGFMLNNVLGEPDVNPVGPIDWPIDTRLASMMCPTLITWPDGTVDALGTGGSSRIRSAIAQVVGRLCLLGETPADAVAAPRVHVEVSPAHDDEDHLDVEAAIGPDVVERLTALFPNHRVWPEPDLYFGGVHAVRGRLDGRRFGAGDARRDGVAIVVG